VLLKGEVRGGRGRGFWFGFEGGSTFSEAGALGQQGGWVGGEGDCGASLQAGKKTNAKKKGGDLTGPTEGFKFNVVYTRINSGAVA